MKWFLGIIFLSSLSFAQDEGFFRQLFIPSEAEEKVLPDYKWISKSAKYLYDLNGNGQKESIQVIKRDAIDYIAIEDNLGNQLFMDSLIARGHKAYLYKLRLVDIAPETRTLILFYYAGVSEFFDLEARTEVYFLTFKTTDLSTLKLVQGPSVFYEKDLYRRGYQQRAYDINVYDYNLDGIKEISSHMGSIHRLWFLDKNLSWSEKFNRPRMPF